MADKTNIAWTDKTWNPWQGCRKVSSGCKNCYMFRDKKRFGQDPSTVIRSKPATFNRPNHWKDPAKVFVCSWSDFFIEDADPWRDEAWEIIRENPHLTFQILTKRPENIANRLPSHWLQNVWLGVTVENQEQADERIKHLCPACVPVKFISVEPMLGEINLLQNFPDQRMVRWYKPMINQIDWIICGGESGPDARHMETNWAQSLKNQCRDSGIPFFMKQMSGNTKKQLEDIPDYLDVREFPING